jgi:hypothetical protein
MSDFMNRIWDTGASAAAWVHQSVKEIPFAGQFYENIAESGLNTTYKVKDYTVEFFKDWYNYLEPKARKYPMVPIAFGGVLVYFLVPSIINHLNEENKKRD